MKKLSVVVCTVDRYKKFNQCIQAIINNEFSDFELIIIDQSSNNESRKVIEQYRNKNIDIHYYHIQKKGAAYARNFGVSHAHGSIIVCTDDDCIPRKDWTKQIVKIFNNPDVLMLFGSVIPLPYDIDKGRTPGGYKKDRVFKGRASMIYQDGTSANLAFKKEVLDKLKGFDEILNNQEFVAEDWDFAYRALVYGFPIHHSSRIFVHHNGFRPWSEAFKMHCRYEMGTAALFMKHLRCGDMVSLWVWMWTFVYKLRGIIVTGFMLKNRNVFAQLSFISQILFLYFIWNIKGCLLSFKYKIDRNKKLYVT